MRRNFAGLITIIVIIVALIVMSMAGSIDFDPASESEFAPNRSTYNSGPTGTRALYQLLEESGTPVARWRSSYSKLRSQANDATLVIIGPFPYGRQISTEDTFLLQDWLSSGGQALIISRSPLEQFADSAIRAKSPDKPPIGNATPEQYINEESDQLITQPTELTREVRGLALSQFASRISFQPEEKASKAKEAATPGAEQEATSPEVIEDQSENYSEPALQAPIIHLGDKEGAALVDFKYGEGRVVFLSDPFVIANNGIARGGNLTLAMNILRSMGAPDRRILFDEFHHGYYNEGNPMVNYFRGTPAPWLLLQGIGLSLLMVYTYSRRFARPLPLPKVDRHSPLEFVGSMANLQQAASARELALENIYPRFKAGLCRKLGLSSRSSIEEIVSAARRRRFPVSEIELRQTLSDAERTLAGEQIDDARLLTLVSRMRRIISQSTTRA